MAGEAISLHARIFAVADCYDAMASDRPYRARERQYKKVIEIDPVAGRAVCATRKSSQPSSPLMEEKQKRGGQ